MQLKSTTAGKSSARKNGERLRNMKAKIERLHKEVDLTDNIDEKISLIQKIGKLNSDAINLEEKMRIGRSSGLNW